MFSFKSINDSRLVAEADLCLGSHVIKFSQINFSDYREKQRKVIVGIGVESESTVAEKVSESLNCIAAEYVLESVLF